MLLGFFRTCLEQKEFHDRVLGWLSPPSLNSVFEELPWRPVGSRGADECLWSCQMRTRLPK